MSKKHSHFLQGVTLAAEEEQRYLAQQADTLVRYTWAAVLVTILFQIYNIFFTLVYTHWTLNTRSSRVYMVLYVLTLVVSSAVVLYRFAAKHRSFPPQRTLALQTAYAAFSMLWALAITLYDQRVSNNVTTYLSLAIFLCILVYLKPRHALLIFGIPQVILTVALFWLYRYYNGDYGTIVSTTAVAAMAIFISCYRYYSDRRSFAEHQTVLSQSRQIQEKNKLLELLVHRDDLTGLYNRRFLKAYLPILCAQARERRETLTVFMVDIDNFKDYNDSFGHQQGDACLRLVAQSLDVQMSQGYFLRYGGEEFCGFVSGLTPDEALEEGAGLCRAVEALKLETGHPKRVVTVSIGVSSSVPEQPDEWKEIIARADRALYQAKRLGKNQAVFEDVQN